MTGPNAAAALAPDPNRQAAPAERAGAAHAEAVPDVAPPPVPSTDAQRERYVRILDTTLAILDEAGPQGLQMRDVSRRADVALATLYRYFPSRDYLIAMALDHWSTGLSTRIRRRPVSAVSAADGAGSRGEQLQRALRSVARAFAAHPHFATAAIVAAASTDPLVTSALQTYRSSFASGLDSVLGGLPEQQRSDVAFIIESVLSSQLVGFSSGRVSRAQLEAALDRTVLILDLGDLP